MYGRPEGYNPADDNIVRVAARQLRTRLKEYYDTDGRAEEWVIEIPKGGYTPVFRRRDAGLTERKAQPATSSHWRLTGIVSACLLAAIGWLWFDNRSLNRQVQALTPQENLVSQIFFQSSNPVSVVVSDAALTTISFLSGESMDLEDYANRKYPELKRLLVWPGKEQFSARMSSRQDTSLADAVIATRIALIAGNRRDRLRIRHARNVRTRDFHADDFIVLGAIRSNPWVGLFEQHLNFYFGAADATAPGQIRNRNPQPGESAVYSSASENDNSGRSYARVALVPNLGNTGKVLLIGGTSMVAMEEAGNFILDPASLPKLTAVLQAAAPGRLEYFELLFEASAVEGASKGLRLIAQRSKQGVNSR